jgi:alanine racemase
MEPRPPRPTIADVARDAGVSKTAVSFAFNSPDRLRPETAARIHAVAEAIGYRPHPVARTLARRETRTIGVVTPHALSVSFANPFFAAFTEGVARAAEESGYGLHFVSPLGGSLPDAVDRAMVDGFVAVGLSGEHPEVEHIRRAGLPFVMVDSPGDAEYGTVEVDDETGARAAAKHLVDLGHVRFLVVGIAPPEAGDRPLSNGVPARRLRGYRSALSEAGLTLSDEWVTTGPASIDGGRAAFTSAWTAGRRPTAVVAMSDASAIGVLRAARDLGLTVPAQLSVVGYDDLDIAEHTNPPLTTVHQPIRRKGEEAVRLLLRRVGRSADRRGQHRRLVTRLVVRGSTGPPPAE